MYVVYSTNKMYSKYFCQYFSSNITLFYYVQFLELSNISSTISSKVYEFVTLKLHGETELFNIYIATLQHFR